MNIELTQDVAYGVSLNRLNKKEKEEIEAIYTSPTGLTEPQFLDLHKRVLENFKTMDRFAVFQVFTVPDIKKFEAMKTAAQALPVILNFISKPNRTDVSSYCSSVGADRFAISFSKHQLVEDYEEKETEDGKVERTKIFENDILFFEAEFIKQSKSIIVLLKFPRFRKEPNKLYDFHTEIEWFINWSLDSIKGQLYTFDLKHFFENLNAPNFDKYGFAVSDVKGEGGEVWGSDFKIQFPFKSKTVASEMFRVIDKVVLPELLESLTEAFSSHLNALAREKVEETLTDFRDFFEQRGLSEEFFNLLHQACEHGIGHVRFFKDKKLFCRYNLEYSRSNFGLIRVSHNGWDAFKPMFGEITSFLAR